MANQVLPKRRIHLGIDFGTSQSKLIFRDYGRRGGDILGNYAVLVRIGRNEGGAGDFRIPSTVTVLKETLYFGGVGEKAASRPGACAYRSLKIRMALPDDFHGVATELPSELGAEDLATLFVVFLIQRGSQAVHRYPPSASSQVSMTMTLGVPMSQLDHPELKELFLRVARIAVHIFRMRPPDFIGGVKISDAQQYLHRAKSEITWSEAVAAEDWIRAEASSALIWSFRSPRVPPGLYAVVDVGAGTTSSSWFRIVDTHEDGQWVKTKMSFFGAACRPPGADAVEAATAQAIGCGDPTTLRGRVNEVFRTRAPESIANLSEICDEIAKAYGEAFGRAYSKDRTLSHWHGSQLFLVGGGSLIDPVRQRVTRQFQRLLGADPPLIDPGHPADLFEETGQPFAGDACYLLVAYGLSHFAADVPETENPNAIPDFMPLALPQRNIEHEDLYSER